MSDEGRRFFLALDDAAALLRAGDTEGAADLRTTVERDYLQYLARDPQTELDV